MILFKNQFLAEKVKKIKDYGKEKISKKIFHKLPAVSNGRLDEFSAAIVFTFLKITQNFIVRKRKSREYMMNICQKT